MGLPEAAPVTVRAMVALVAAALTVAAVPTTAATDAIDTDLEPWNAELPSPGVSETALDAAPCAGIDKPVHPQIEIERETGEKGFILGYDPVNGEPIYRPGSGVTDGSGTEDDPYVIEDWCIPVTRPPASPEWPGTEVGLYIHKTDAHVVVRDVAIVGPTTEPLQRNAGIQLTYAHNVQVENVTIENHGIGGVFAYKSDDVTLHNVTAVNVTEVGLRGSHTEDMTIEDTTVSGTKRGVMISTSSGATLRDTSVSARVGVYVIAGSTNTLVEENTIEGNDLTGMLLQANVEDTLVQANVIQHNGIGALVGPVLDHAHPAQGTVFTGNAIADNDGPGLEVRGPGIHVDATNNWWGAADGPAGDVEDACTGTLADGSGDAIVVDEAEVCFDPWLGTAPATAP